jgi:hypothetical protein
MIDKVPKPGGGAARIGYVTNVHTLASIAMAALAAA